MDFIFQRLDRQMWENYTNKCEMTTKFLRGRNYEIDVICVTYFAGKVLHEDT